MAWGTVSHSFHQLAGIPGACSCPAGKPLLERRQVNLGWYLPVVWCPWMIPLCLKQRLGDSDSQPLSVFSVTSLKMLHAVSPASLAAVVVEESPIAEHLGRIPRTKWPLWKGLMRSPTQLHGEGLGQG